MNTDLMLYTRWTQSRDADAYRELMLRYADMVYATCRRITGNPSVAEDVAQECFLKLAEGRHAIRTSVAGWLHTLATSRSLDWRRGENRRARLEERYAATSEPLEIAWDDLQLRIDEAIQELPDPIKEIIVRHFLQCESQSRIAASSGMSRKSVSRQIDAGIELVRSTLQRQGITVAATAFVAMVTQHAAEAAPATLKEVLGKLALSGQPAALISSGIVLASYVKCGIAAVFVVGFGVVLNNFVRSGTTTKTQEVIVPPIEKTAQNNETIGLAPFTITPVESSVANMPSTNLAATRAQPATRPASFAITGIVRDESDQPVAGARVEASVIESFPQIPPTLFSAQTGDDGTYSISDTIADEKIAVRISKTGFMDALKQIEGIPGGKKENVDFTLVPGVTLLGRVLSPGGVPVPGATIIPQYLPQDSSSWKLNEGDFVLVSDENGRFQIGLHNEGIKADWISASQQERHWFLQSMQIVSPGYGASHFLDIEFKDGQLVDFRLQDAAAIRGTVMQNDGTPAVGYIVGSKAVVQETQGGRRFSVPVSAVVDAEGKFAFDSLPPNLSYVAYLLKPDGKYLRGFENQSPILVPGKVHIWDLTLIKPIRVSGSVYVEGTREVYSRASVWAQPLDEGQKDGKADFNQDGGAFEVELSAAGRYLMYPMCEVLFDTQSPASITDFRSFGNVVDVQPGDDIHLDLELPAPFILPVRVVDANGQPITKAALELSWALPDGQSARTTREPDSEGRYAWYCEPGHEVWIAAVAEGYRRTNTQRFVGEAGKRIEEQVLTLDASRVSAGLRANIVIPDGVALAGGVCLSVTYADGSAEDIPITMYGQGEYRAKDSIRAGLISVAAVEIGTETPHSSQTVECEVAPGELYDLGDLVMR